MRKFFGDKGQVIEGINVFRIGLQRPLQLIKSLQGLTLGKFSAGKNHSDGYILGVFAQMMLGQLNGQCIVPTIKSSPTFG